MAYFKTGILIILSLYFHNIYAQATEETQQFVSITVADMDGDGIADSLIYDNVDLTLTIKLSSKGFEPFTTEYPGVYELGVEIQALTGGFAAHAPHMRASNTHTYFYDEETGRFRLAGYWHEHIHCGWMNVDLVADNFSACWHENSQFTLSDSLIHYPPVNFTLYHDPIYLGDNEPDFMGLGSHLLNDLEGIYTPPQTDTVRFINLWSTFDESDPYIPDQYNLLIYYYDKNGDRQYGIYASDEWPNRDDLIEITTGYVFYHDTYNNIYVVEPAITELNIIRPGVVSIFSQANTKLYELHNEAGYAEQTGELIYDGVLYFLITTEESKIRKHMDGPGKLDVFYSELEDEITSRNNSWSYGILLDVYNTDNGRKKHLGKYIMGVIKEDDFLYYDLNLNPI